MKSSVIISPGSNCDRDMMVAIERITGHAPAAVWHRETELPEADFIALPGGFTYGDYLRPGAIAARSPILTAVKQRAAAGVPVLGVCNGFQVLTETGLLPGALIRNAGLTFVCRDTRLRVETAESPFLRSYREGEILRIPLAHHDGNYVAAPDTLERLEGEGRIAFRYVDAHGAAKAEANPNGSAASIAGVLNARGNVLGMMPHPERAIESAHGGTDGRRLFESVMAALAPA